MKRDVLVIFGLIAITLAAFSGLGQCGFINLDDPGYVFNNPHVTGGFSPRNFAWAWTTFEQGNYLPLTWLSLMLNVTLFGRGPHGFHWVNLAFHAANAVLVYLVFRQASGAVWRSALVAALFAVHPLRVESVAWIVERKDVLTGFFALLAMLTYLRYTRELKWQWYAATLLSYAAALLAKQTLATLPFVLLLLDYWPLGRWIRGSAVICSNDRPRRSWPQLLLEKLPLLAMAAAILAITARAQASDRAIVDFQSVPLTWRLANVPISYARYLGKMVWFGNLAVLYPRQLWTAAQVVPCCLLLVIITVICLCKLRSSPWLTVGWLWFLGVLIPMIGIMQFGAQAMADRFTYFAGIGLLLMVSWSIPESVWRKPVLVTAAVGTTISMLILFTIVQTRYWQNSVVLFTHDIRVAGATSVAELNLGAALFERGELQPAIIHFDNAVNLEPGNAKAQGDLAIALAKNHRFDEAIRHCAVAVHRQPKDLHWNIELAELLIAAKRYEEAAAQCRKAIALSPYSAQAHHLMGLSLCEMERVQDGISELKIALSIKPDLTDAQLDLQRFQNSAKQK